MRYRPGKHDIDPRTQREYLTEPPKEGPAGGSARDNPYSVNPASPFRRSRTELREVRNVSTNAESEETEHEYRQRVNENDYTQRVRKTDNRNRAVIAIIVTAFSFLIAGFVAWNVYLTTIDANLGSSMTDSTRSALESSDDGAPYYVLMVGTDTGDGGQAVVSSLMLVRVDTQTPTVTAVSLPCDTRVYVDGSGYGQISAVLAAKGASGLIAVVDDLTGVEVNHYLQYDAAGALKIVDDLGGIQMQVPDNTQYNGVYVSSGDQKVTSAQALVCFRCHKTYQTGVAQQMWNQRMLLEGILDSFADAFFISRLQAVSDISGSVITDMSALDILAIGAALQGAPDDTSYHSAAIPTTNETDDGIAYAIVGSDGLKAMMSNVDAGLDPLAGQEDASEDIDPSDHRIFVRNGSGVSGCASQASEKLTAAGYGIEGTGNADQYVYNETLVVYSSSDQESLAEAVVNVLGVGRVVQNLGGYTYDGDLLVVVGKDWIPT